MYKIRFLGISISTKYKNLSILFGVNLVEVEKKRSNLRLSSIQSYKTKPNQSQLSLS